MEMAEKHQGRKVSFFIRDILSDKRESKYDSTKG